MRLTFEDPSQPPARRRAAITRARSGRCGARGRGRRGCAGRGPCRDATGALARRHGTIIRNAYAQRLIAGVGSGRCSDRTGARRVRERPLIRRRFGVRATAPDAMARQFALVRAFRDRERRRVSIAAVIGVAVVAVIARVVAVARPGWPGTIAAFAGSSVAFAGPHVRARGRRPPPRRDPRARAVPLGRSGRRAALDGRHRRSTAIHAVPRPGLARGALRLAAPGPTFPASSCSSGSASTTPPAGWPSRCQRPPPEERFDRALEVALVSFVGSGDGDLADARAALDALANERGPPRAWPRPMAARPTRRVPPTASPPPKPDSPWRKARRRAAAAHRLPRPAPGRPHGGGCPCQRLPAPGPRALARPAAAPRRRPQRDADVPRGGRPSPR